MKIIAEFETVFEIQEFQSFIGGVTPEDKNRVSGGLIAVDLERLGFYRSRAAHNQRAGRCNVAFHMHIIGKLKKRRCSIPIDFLANAASKAQFYVRSIIGIVNNLEGLRIHQECRAPGACCKGRVDPHQLAEKEQYDDTRYNAQPA